MSEKKKGRIWKAVLIPVLILAALSVTAFLLYKSFNEGIYTPLAGQSDAKKADVTIDSSNVNALPDILFDNGLIKNKQALRVYLKLSGNDSRLKAGKYELSSAMSASQMINKMTRGEVKKDLVRVTIPEGYTIKDIAALMESKGFGDKQKFLDVILNNSFDFEFLKNLPNRTGKIEGYLFPDTYDFPKNSTPEQIVKRLLSRFDDVFNQDMRKKAQDMGMTIDKIVTIASMIEKEARVDDERPVIAGVIYNRLKIKMPLQIDATVQYSLGQWKDSVSTKDTEVNSPYNTYKVNGLPIGPISNPGKSSLEAALNPKQSDYIYYVYKNDDTHTHAFSKGYQEFLENKRKYITKK